MKQIQLQILTFGIAKEIIGKQVFDIDLPENSTVQNLKNMLFEQYPELGKLKSLSIAVNNEYAESNYSLSTSDEIALIPPVSGG
ncbi:MoaD/ThiS family protein [Chondrinema litorale]|uniref:MoaD/ThiS family protein n=1 Tax=Chondrinema litorale TaxID=2994555 RepID=UPI002543F85B|nr:MoaD/ThiS family protein [Chondrinema litorale]UZR94606.1 MoaD/ThiS family protein [Chondrinema litorale]